MQSKIRMLLHGLLGLERADEGRDPLVVPGLREYPSQRVGCT